MLLQGNTLVGATRSISDTVIHIDSAITSQRNALTGAVHRLEDVIVGQEYELGCAFLGAVRNQEVQSLTVKALID